MKLVFLLLLVGGGVVLVATYLSKSSVGEFNQSDVDRIAAECKVPIGRMILHRGWITVAAPTDDDLAGGCMMQALKRSGKKSVQVVHNELHISDHRE